ncbi:MAG: GGDEF domain-containing protein [Proteobacteria bacterium]|nr:GGDEF domain-containing protein [Pseudomonadota bacterium]
MDESKPGSVHAWLRSGEFLFGALLFAAAIAALVLATSLSGVTQVPWRHAVFFLAFGVFTISIGYSHPVFGYVSFDRLAQVSSILVLGPVDAAWINGLASLLYPWHRLRQGVPLRAVCNAALTNAGLMALAILIAGMLYVEVGGPVPLAGLDPATFGAIVLLLVALQFINEGGIVALVRVRGQSSRDALSLFDTIIELMAGLAAILLAVVWTRMEMEVFLLLLAVLAALMLALKRYAEIRLKLERLVEDRTAALREKTLQLEQLAAHDQLTGLHNRRHADEFLQREFEHADRPGAALAIALADIDNFKEINDSRSHSVGDRVLERVGRIFRERTRKCDLVARYGGEEFLFAFVGMNELDAARLQDLRLAVESEDWPAVSPGLRVTMSIGLAIHREAPGVPALLRLADARLYRAKQLGRNCVVAELAVD